MTRQSFFRMSPIWLLVSLSVVCARPVRSSEDAQSFYIRFRQAALDGNVALLTELTHFPFRTRGELDHDPVEHHNARQFAGLVERLLNERSADNTRSVRDVLRSHTRIGPDDYQGSPDSIRIENLVFDRLNGHWRFTFAYITLRGE